MHAKKLHYDLSELDHRNDGLGGFIELNVWDDTGNSVSIITNNAGEGRWVRNRNTGELKQVEGTCQYRLPQSKSGIRKRLRKEYNDAWIMHVLGGTMGACI